MTPLEDILRRVRSELGDSETTFQETAVSTGDTNRYSFNHAPMNALTTRVFVDGVDITDNAEPDGVAIEEATGTAIFDYLPRQDALIVVTGTAYRFFTDAELGRICQDSVGMHVNGRTDVNGRPLDLDNLDSIEIYPLTLLCTINALYVLATDASFDIDIQAPDGMVVPRSQRYRQLMEMIDMLRGRYQELCQALNIGLFKIEVYTLRRISKRTNRYVPVYKPQEIDDRSRPERVYLPLPTYGGQTKPDSVESLDLTIAQGDTFSQVIEPKEEVPLGAVMRAQIRGFAGSPVLIASFTITRIGDTNQFVIALSSDQTRRLPRNAWWDIQRAIDVDGEDDVKTLYRGRVYSPREVTTESPKEPEITGVTTNPDAPLNIGYQNNASIWSQNGMP